MHVTIDMHTTSVRCRSRGLASGRPSPWRSPAARRRSRRPRPRRRPLRRRSPRRRSRVKPAPPPEPQLTPAQAKQQAQKLTIDAIAQLQNGEVAAAQKMLEQAQALDPANDLAKKMQDQIKADPQKELGTVFFRYTVQRDDSLSKIAQTYMGDRFKFHILAKYNDIANPSKLAAGQVIKVPGQGPAAAAAAAATAAPARRPRARPSPPRTSRRRRRSRPRRRATRRWR